MTPAKGSGTVSLSPGAARLVGDTVPEDEQLAALGGVPSLPLPEFCTVAGILAGSGNPQVRDAARQVLGGLTLDAVAEFLADPELHPRFLDLIARTHAGNPIVTELVFWHPAVSDATRTFLTEQQPLPEPTPAAPEANQDSDEEEPRQGEEPEPESEEARHQTAYQLAQKMSIGDKIKMALTGDKEWRVILVKDTIKPVCCAVLKNPRITDAEILTIARSAVQYDDIIRLICANREWLKKYPIRKALVENHRTPLPTALKLLSTLGEKDLTFLAKSKNIATIIATQARKMVLEKKK